MPMYDEDLELAEGRWHNVIIRRRDWLTTHLTISTWEESLTQASCCFSCFKVKTGQKYCCTGFSWTRMFSITWCVFVCRLFYCKVMEETSILRLQTFQPGWAPVLAVLWPFFKVRRVNLIERVLGADDGGETCRSVGREVRVEPEGLPDVGPHVLGLALQPREEGHQLHQLIVLLVHKPRLNGDPILQLISKGLQKR